MTKKNHHIAKLPIPIKIGDKTIKEVKLREPMTGELRGLKIVDVMQMDVAAMITLIPRISDVPLTEQDIGEMKPANFMQLAGMTAAFFVNPADLPPDLEK